MTCEACRTRPFGSMMRDGVLTPTCVEHMREFAGPMAWYVDASLVRPPPKVRVFRIGPSDEAGGE